MGKSPSIAKLEMQEDDFRAYIQKLEGEIAAKASKAKSELQKTISEFYSSNGYDDAKDFVSGSNYDFMQKSEFSLSNLKSIIDAISKAIFAGAAAPSGADVNESSVEAASKALGAEVGEIANLELYIAGKAFDVLSAVILSFGTTDTLSFSTSSKSESLGYGLQLFTTIASESYTSHSFFNNNEIYEYLYIYDVKFSEKQAKTEISQTLVQLYENEIATFVSKSDELLNELSQGTISPEAYDSASSIYQTLIDKAQKKVDELTADAK